MRSLITPILNVSMLPHGQLFATDTSADYIRIADHQVIGTRWLRIGLQGQMRSLSLVLLKMNAGIKFIVYMKVVDWQLDCILYHPWIKENYLVGLHLSRCGCQ